MRREAALALAQARREQYVRQFKSYLRIPSISTNPAYRAQIEEAASWLAADMRQIGLKEVAIMPTNGHPVVYGEWMEAVGAPTLLIYGHYDVQPIDPIDAWLFDPFGAEEDAGKIYARGASDNKGQHFSHLKAIETILAQNQALPINIKLFLDGEEEIGSPNLAPFVQANATLLAADALLISDGPMLRPAQPSLEYAIRGIVALELHLTGPTRDLHSGNYGGSVHNPAQVMADMLAALHNDAGQVTIPGFYDDVQPIGLRERAMLERVGYDLAQWQAETGAAAPWGEAEYTILERITVRPTLEINGLWSGHINAGMKTIIPTTAHAKLTARLVPHQNPTTILQQITAYIHQLTPPTVRATILPAAHAPAAITPIDGPEIRAGQHACRAVWGVPPVLTRAGGSLPIVATLQSVLGIPFLLMPFGLDDNRHAPNEYYDIDYLERGIQTAIHYYFNYAQEYKNRTIDE